MTSDGRLKAAIHYLVPTLVANGLPLISLPFLTRQLTPEDFGLIALTQAYGLFVFGLANLGLVQVYERDFFKHRESPARTSALVWTCLVFASLASVAALGFSLVGIPLLEKWIFQTVAPPNFIVLMVAGALVRGTAQIAYTYLRNQERAKTFAVIASVEGVLSFVLTMGLVVGLNHGVMGVAIAQTSATIAAFFVLIAVVGAREKFSWDSGLLRDTLKLGAPLTLRAFLGVVSNQLDKYMLGILGALGQVGVFSLGQRVGQVTFLFMNSLDYVFVPATYRMMFAARGGREPADAEREQAVARQIGTFLTPYAYVSAAIAMTVGLFAEEAFLLLTTERFFFGAQIAPVLSFHYALMFFGKVNGRQLIFAGKTWRSSVLPIVSLAVSFALYVPFIGWFGALGAALATLISGVVFTVVTFYQAQAAFPIRWEQAKLASIYGLLLAALAAQIVLLNGEFNYWLRLGTKIGFVAAFLYLGLAARLIPSVLRDKIERWLGRSNNAVAR